MTIRTTDEKHLALYDSVTGIAFGPIFEGTDDASPTQEADAFMRWFEGTISAAGTPIGDIGYLRTYHTDEQKAVADKWRALVADHPETECPFDIDRDSYGIGYTGDSDKSRGDYTEATPDSCSCECHKRLGGVFDTGGRNR